MSVHVVGLPADRTTGDDIAAVHRVLLAAQAADRPGDPPIRLEDVAARLGNARPDWRRPRWVARDGTGVVGYARLRLPLLDNPHLAFAELVVHPDQRRRGIGTALLRTLLDAASAADRTTLFGEANQGTGGEGFCRALGLEPVQTHRISLLRLADVDWADLERVAAAADPPGYRVETWTDHVPDELLAGYTAAKNAMNDAPFGDADFTDFVFTPETVRSDEESARSLGEAWIVAAVHEPTGAVAAFTELLVSRPAFRSHQNDTAVVPEHRGSGPGAAGESRDAAAGPGRAAGGGGDPHRERPRQRAHAADQRPARVPAVLGDPRLPGRGGGFGCGRSAIAR